MTSLTPLSLLLREGARLSGDDYHIPRAPGSSGRTNNPCIFDEESRACACLSLVMERVIGLLYLNDTPDLSFSPPNPVSPSSAPFASSFRNLHPRHDLSEDLVREKSRRREARARAREHFSRVRRERRYGAGTKAKKRNTRASVFEMIDSSQSPFRCPHETEFRKRLSCDGARSSRFESPRSG